MDIVLLDIMLLYEQAGLLKMIPMDYFRVKKTYA